MPPVTAPPRLWINWLLAASAGIALFGMILVMAPALTRQGFSLLVYGSASAINAFGPEQGRYVSLVHAVIGGVMVGWGVCLFLVTRERLSKGDRFAWNLLAISLGAWFVPDTTYSLLSSYWQNAVLNLGFLILFAIPLLGVRRYLAG